MDENVCIGHFRKYFSFDAWNLLEATMDTMRTQGSWTCSVCHIDLHASESICCDGCLDWVHLTDYTPLTPIGVMHAREPPLTPIGVSTAILALWHPVHSKEREAIALSSCL